METKHWALIYDGEVYARGTLKDCQDVATMHANTLSGHKKPTKISAKAPHYVEQNGKYP